MNKQKILPYVIGGLGGALVLYLILKPKLAAAYSLPTIQPTYPQPTYPSPYYPETKWGFLSELSKSIANAISSMIGKKATVLPPATPTETSGVLYI